MAVVTHRNDRGEGHVQGEHVVARTDMSRVFDAMSTAYVLVRADAAQTIIDANEAFYQLVGMRPEHLLGLPQFDVFVALPQNLVGGRNPIADLYDRVFSTRLPDAVPILRYDVLTGDGGSVERWWSLMLTPLLDAHGDVEVFFCRVDDVTEYVHEQTSRGQVLDGSESSMYSRLQIGTATQLAQAQASLRLSALAECALRMTSATTLDDVVRIVAEHAAPAIEADGAGLAVPTDDRRWRLAGSSGFSEAHRHDYELVPYDSPLPVCRSARTGERILLPDAAAADAFDPVMTAIRAENGRRAWATLPLRVGGEILGGLAVGWSRDHPFTVDDVEFLDACAAQCAQALERIISERTAREEVGSVRRMAQTLQRSLLTRPPVREGLHLAVRYQPAALGAEVGGDWFDAFATRSRGTVLVVGDVSGHDQLAAAAMGQVRNMVRGIAFDGDDRPANLLSRVDQAMAGLELNALATAVLAVVDPPVTGLTSRRLRWANAGHLPPLLRHRDGRVEVLRTEDDLMLGVDAAFPRHEHVVDLEPGDVLVLYTDGLVERRGRDIDEGIGQIRRSLMARDSNSADAWADALLATMRAPGVEDDTALLVLQVDAAPAPRRPAVSGDVVEIVLPADPRSVRDARRAVDRLGHRNGLDADLVEAAVLLTSELVTNAIVHGRSDARLKVTATARSVRVEVADDNDRIPVLQTHDDEALSGRGVSLLELMASSWGVEEAGIGKVVWFCLDGA
jgi:serine phosphatase RsbU (regulator of sigma subunit)/anti-sigma regulatory factor (Ser/Thr protein kinase)